MEEAADSIAYYVNLCSLLMLNISLSIVVAMHHSSIKKLHRHFQD